MVFEKNLKSAPTSVIDLLNLGKTRYHLGQMDKAAEAWKRALSLDPHNVEAADLLSRLASKKPID